MRRIHGSPRSTAPGQLVAQPTTRSQVMTEVSPWRPCACLAEEASDLASGWTMSHGQELLCRPTAV